MSKDRSSNPSEEPEAQAPQSAGGSEPGSTGQAPTPPAQASAQSAPAQPYRPASVADFTFRAGELTTEDLKVTRFEGTEGISELYRFRLELCSDERNIPLTDVVGKPCLLQIDSTHARRFVNGIVRRFERTGEGSRLTYYAAEIVPTHWLLTKRHRSRLFLESNCPDMTVPGIIKKVFTDAGIPEDNYRFALQGSYPTHEMIVQYRETEFDFISRLMEHEGIFYFFEHTADGHKMVVADSGVAHVPVPGEAEFPFRTPTGLVAETEREHIFSVRDSEEIRSGTVSLDDFNFQQPALQLRAETAADNNTSLGYVDYPGEYVERGVGERYAQVRLEEFQCAKRVLHMAGTARGLLPGFKFTLSEHPNEALNCEYLITHLSHRASQPQSGQEEATAVTTVQYEVDIRTIVAGTPFRAPRKTPKPTVNGSQTALVVGPSGEEIYTDEYGRVKVQFHWDQEGTYDENSSFWIRVSQGSAGGQYGMMFLPRVGQEVIVDFLEGDPDQPIITGRVYNNDLMPPYSLPGEKTKSVIKTHSSKGGGGTNEIRFEDLKDKEQLFIQAQRQMDTRVKASHFHTVGGSYHVHIGGEEDGQLGGDLHELIYKDKHVHVKNDLRTNIDNDESRTVGGKVSIKVTGTRSTDVGGDVVDKFGANHKHEVTMTYALKALAVKIEASTCIELKCGGSSIVLTPAAIFIMGGPLVNINSGAGPPVAPVTAMATSPEAAEDAGAADKSDPGYDITYNPATDSYPPVKVKPQVFKPAELPEPEPVSTWVEFQLLDAKKDDPEPVQGESYRVELPDGKIESGNTDDEGKAIFEGLTKRGWAKVQFPNRYDNEWKKLRVERREDGSEAE